MSWGHMMLMAEINGDADINTWNRKKGGSSVMEKKLAKILRLKNI